MLELEDRLRESLRSRAEAVPISPGLWARIEERSRRRRRRRAGVAVGALVAVIAAGVGIVTAIGHSPETTARVTTQGPSGHWSELPSSPLAPRSDQYGLWTGHEMVIWGGRDFSSDHQLTDGAAYNPSTRRWRRIPEPPFQLAYRSYNAPGAQNPPAVWTGTEMLIFGNRPTSIGMSQEDGALAYNPATHRWRTLATPPTGMNLYASAAVWTGQQVVIFGGPNVGLSPPPSPANNNGIGSVSTSSLGVSASYDPHTDRWSPIAGFPLDPRTFETATWTGREVILWGGENPARLPLLNNGAAYNPQTNQWRILPPAPIPGRYLPGSAWTGHELVIWGGQGPGLTLGDGAAYNASTNQWRRLPPGPLTARQPIATVWTGKQALMIGGIVRHLAVPPGRGTVTDLATDAAAYDPASDRWQNLPMPPFTGCGGPTVMWDGHQALFWGGQQCATPNTDLAVSTNRGLSYRP